MLSLKLLCVLQLYVFLVSAYPRETLEHLVKDYAEGIENLKKTARSIKFDDSDEDYIKIVKTEPVVDHGEYDFIVIGGGSAGSVVANRLTEVPEWNVLVLEAGKPESKVGQIPAMAELLQLSEANWGYKMEPQQHACLGMKDQACLAPRGKSLGGTSAINTMLYTRGNALDYDRWADLGPKGWCYNDVLPYFKKSEDINISHFDNKYHKKGGPLNVEDTHYKTPLSEAFLEAGKELGYNTIDINGKEPIGFGKPQITTHHGHRTSSSAAFLEPIKHRKNLVIYPESHVTKIHIGEHTNEVTGVEYVKDKTLHIAKAKREVILSAGPISSPQILMLSGVGPKEDLENLQIPCKADLPVGRNLQDHMTFMGLNFLLNDTEEVTHEHTLTSPENIKQWLLEGNGPLASPGGIEGVAYVKTKVSKEVKDYPDIEIIVASRKLNKESGEIFQRVTGLTDELYQKVMAPLEGHKVWSIFPLLLHPQSTGHITLKSVNPFQWPKIYSNFLTDKDEIDVHTMVEGIKKALAISHTAAFQKHGCKLHEPLIPGCEKHGEHTDEYWKCAVRHMSRTVHHQVGTCKMGAATDKSAVVDEHLKVHGIKGLRVADSSVIPFSISAHTNAPAVMIGEKASDLIKSTWH